MSGYHGNPLGRTGGALVGRIDFRNRIEMAGVFHTMEFTEQFRFLASMLTVPRNSSHARCGISLYFSPEEAPT